MSRNGEFTCMVRKPYFCWYGKKTLLLLVRTAEIAIEKGRADSHLLTVRVLQKALTTCQNIMLVS